jgi:cobalt-zinc-cadmium efflux system outer membrane protein
VIVLCLTLLVQSPPDSISLEEALQRAARDRGTVTAAVAGVAEARAAFSTAGAVTNPTVSFSYSESTPTRHLSVDQPLDWLLRRGPDRGAARAGLNRALADSAQAVAGLLRDVRSTFYRARAARLAEELVLAQAALADSVAQIAAARLRAGDISLLEQEQAAQEAARARQTASTAREAALVAEAELARAIAAEGGPPRAAGPLDAGLDHLPDTTLELSAIYTVRAAAADSAVAAFQARSAARRRVPLPSITSGAEWGDPTQPGALALIGVALPLPLWNREGGPVGEARARAVRASALLREARLDARRLVRQARVHLVETAARARFDRDSLVPGAGALRARAVRAYRAGETGILPVLDALRSEREAALAMLQDQLAFQEALADWYALKGRSR